MLDGNKVGKSCYVQSVLVSSYRTEKRMIFHDSLGNLITFGHSNRFPDAITNGNPEPAPLPPLIHSHNKPKS